MSVTSNHKHNHETTTPIEYDEKSDPERCLECGTPVSRVADREEWCVVCAAPPATHPTGKPPEMRLRVENRFWSKVDIRERDQCWEWGDYATDDYGYGMFKLDGRARRAHRVAVMLDLGLTSVDDIPGEVVRHSCDNEPCCNPRHLLPGSTQSENALDAVMRSGGTALSPRDVRDIRDRAAGGELQTDIAGEYGLSESFVSEVVNGKKYAWVE